jgi:hypothetical protein
MPTTILEDNQMDVFIVHQIEEDGRGGSASYILGVASTLKKAERIRDFYKFTWEQACMDYKAEWEITCWAVDEDEG